MPLGRGEQDDPSFDRSEESRTVGHGPFGADQYDRAVCVGETRASTSDMKGPICFTGKLTTAAT